MNYSMISIATVAALYTASSSASDLRVCHDGTQLNPNDRFNHQVITTDNGDMKVVNDAATGLQWSYCFVGQNLSSDQTACEGVPVVPYDFTPEVKYYPNVRQKIMDAVITENKRLGTTTNSWRLPNVNELLSIYNEKCIPSSYPAFNVKHNVSKQEIEELINVKISWRDPYHKIVEAQATIDRGNAYNTTLITTGTAQAGEHLFYHSISFDGHGNITNRSPKRSAMLRLVRKTVDQQ